MMMMMTYLLTYFQRSLPVRPGSRRDAKEEHLRIVSAGFCRPDAPSCHAADSVRSLKETSLILTTKFPARENG